MRTRDIHPAAKKFVAENGLVMVKNPKGLKHRIDCSVFLSSRDSSCVLGRYAGNAFRAAYFARPADLDSIGMKYYPPPKPRKSRAVFDPVDLFQTYLGGLDLNHETADRIVADFIVDHCKKADFVKYLKETAKSYTDPNLSD